MSHELVPVEQAQPPGRRLEEFPALVVKAGNPAVQAWLDLFEGKIPNRNTRRNYMRAVRKFLAWAENQSLELHRIMASDVGRYLSHLSGGPNKKKIALASFRKFFRFMVERHICIINPASDAETVRHEVVEGVTPEITDAQFRAILSTIDRTTLVGLRDTVIFTMLAYTASRAGAVARIQRHHYYDGAGQWMLHFDEKRGKSREIPVAHDLKLLLDEYLERSGIKEEKRTKNQDGDWEPLYIFRTANRRTDKLTETPMSGNDIYKMMQRLVKRAGVAGHVVPHSFRVAIATDLHRQGIAIENIQAFLGHSDVRTTRVYVRDTPVVTRNLVERIRLGR